MSIFSKIRDLFTGGSSKKSKSSTRKARTVSNYGGGGSRSVRDSYGTAVSRAKQNREDEEKRRRQEAQRKQQQRTDALKQMAQRTDALSSGKTTSSVTGMQTSGSGRTRAVAKIAEKTQDKRTEALRKLADERKEFHKATGNKYNTEAGTKEERARARQRIKSGEYQGDADVEKFEVKHHPVAASAARGALSGATFGASELLAQKSKKRKETGAEQFYQQNKNKYAEMGGELVGSLASFGGTAGLTEKAGAKLVSKVAPNAAEALAGTKLVQRSAVRAATKAAEKGAVKGVSAELIEQIGKNKAAKVVNALGNDIVQNLTTGALYDINKASAEHEVGSPEWWKELGTSAAFNSVVTGGVAAGSMLGGGRRLVGEAAETLARNEEAAQMRRAFVENAEEANRTLDRGFILPGDAARSTTDPNATTVNIRQMADATNASQNAKRQATLDSLLRKAEQRAPQGPERPGIGPDAVRLANANTKRAQLNQINDELDQVQREILLKRNTASDVELASLNDRFDELLRARDAIENPQAAPDIVDDVVRNADQGAAESVPAARDTRQELIDRRAELQEEWNKFERGESKLTPYQIEDMGEEIDRIDEQIRSLDADAGQSIEPEAPRAESEQPRPGATERYQAVRNAERAQGLGTGKYVEPPKTVQPEVSAQAPEPKVKLQTADEAVDGAAKETIDRTVKTEAERRNIRATHEQLNADIQRVSDGKYGARKSYVTAADFAGDKEVDRLAAETRKVMDDLGNGDGLGDTLKTDRTYLRNTREVRDSIAKEQAAKALNDPAGTIEKLRAKLAAGDDFTLEDYGQMTAIKNYCKQQGIELPEEVAKDFSRIYMTSQTDRAQLLRSSYLFMAENDPEFKAHLMRKDLERFRERVCHVTDKEWSEMSKLLDDAKGTDGWLEKEIERLSGLTGAKNREKFEKEYRDLCKEIYTHTEPSFWEVVSLIRHSFMLSNVKTGLNNIIGNVSQLSMYRLSDMLHVAMENQIEKAAKASGKDFRRTTTLLKNDELKKLASWGSLQSGKVGEAISKNADETEFAKLFNKEVKDRVSQAMGDSKYGFDWEKGSAIRHEGAGKIKGAVTKGAQKLAKGVGFMLNEPDSWFVEKSYRLAFAKYLEANGITSAKAFADNEALIKEASDHAFNIALENTYKKANRVVNFLEGARSKGYAKHSKLYQKAIALGLDAELPYLKVPVNLVVNNFKYSPMGLLKGGVDAASALKSGDIETLNKACTELSKGLTGTGMAMLGFFLTCEDQADENDWGFISSARDELKEYGVRDNSLKIGNKNLSISNMGIGTVQFLMGARYGEELNARGGAPSGFLDNFEVLTSAFAANFDAIADMSLLDNAFAILDAVGNKGEYDMKRSEQLGNLGVTIAGNYVGQFVPSPLRGIARGTTSSDLDTNIKKGEGDKFTRQMRRSANNVISGVPGLNEKVLPHKVDRHGNLVNERKTAGEKTSQVVRNIADPFNTKTVNIPKADLEEMKVTTESGKPFQPKGYDENRKYQAKIGQGKHAEVFDLTGKEREQAARSYKNSGYDSAYNVIKKGYFGDSHGERAAEILKNIPDDEEKAREYIFATPEYQKLDNDGKNRFLNAWYDMRQGRGRTANEEVYVNIKGGDEGDFRYQNDLHWRQQDKYEDNNLAEYGITKGQWADIIEAAQYESHKYTEEGGNKDTINSASKLKNALLNVDGLSAEQRVAAYQAIRGKRNGFGWYDWNGVSKPGGYRRRRWRRWHRWSRGGGSSKKATVPKPKALKMSDYIMGEALTSKSSSSKTSSKVTPPKLKRVESKIDLPNARK